MSLLFDSILYFLIGSLLGLASYYIISYIRHKRFVRFMKMDLNNKETIQRTREEILEKGKKGELTGTTVHNLSNSLKRL